mmetsp:Transcript_63431/g.178514  ORF Transcript_63431/g.178514 Transcript_63431/m.178514 type:complete len:242 (-) Transcript_63431:103-828(-)
MWALAQPTPAVSQAFILASFIIFGPVVALDKDWDAISLLQRKPCAVFDTICMMAKSLEADRSAAEIRRLQSMLKNATEYNKVLEKKMWNSAEALSEEREDTGVEQRMIQEIGKVALESRKLAEQNAAHRRTILADLEHMADDGKHTEEAVAKSLSAFLNQTEQLKKAKVENNDLVHQLQVERKEFGEYSRKAEDIIGRMRKKMHVLEATKSAVAHANAERARDLADQQRELDTLKQATMRK